MRWIGVDWGGLEWGGFGCIESFLLLGDAFPNGRVWGALCTVCVCAHAHAPEQGHTSSRFKCSSRSTRACNCCSLSRLFECSVSQKKSFQVIPYLVGRRRQRQHRNAPLRTHTLAHHAGKLIINTLRRMQTTHSGAHSPNTCARSSKFAHRYDYLPAYLHGRLHIASESLKWRSLSSLRDLAPVSKKKNRHE